MSTEQTIRTIERLKSSRNGNPKYVITFESGMRAPTSSDAAFCYAVGNLDMREGSRVLVDETRVGNIKNMRPVNRG